LIHSLRVRLFAGALVFITLALLLTWLTLTRLFEKHVTVQYERELVSVIDTIAAKLDRDKAGLVLEAEPSDPRFTIPAGGRYWQLWLEGTPLIRSRSLWDTELKYSDDPEAYGRLVTMTGPSDTPVMAVSEILTIDGKKDKFKVVVTAASDKAEIESSLDAFRNSLFEMLGLTALFLVLASAFQIFVGLSPLMTLRQQVMRIRDGQADRISESGPTEVRPLVTEINSLLLAERAAVERARARAADLAHGLKTPLTVLGQIGEALARDRHTVVAEQIHEQVGMIRARTDRQLAMARVAGTGSHDLNTVPLIGKLVAALRLLPDERKIEWVTKLPNEIRVAVDATDFAEAIGNILDNAARYARSKIIVSATRGEGMVKLVIEDDGPGIDDDDLVRMLRRGQRADESDTGNGLGLAISSDIAHAYGASISLSRSSLKGLAVTTTWPLVRVGASVMA
jgi:signal transduction histidine kinase